MCIRDSSYEVYSDIKANPTIENVQNGVRAFRASGADYIVTIGGGSSMDTAKAIGIIAANPEFADVRSLEGVAPTKHPSVPIIAVPTTAEMCIRDSPSIKDFYKMICEYLVNTLMSRACLLYTSGGNGHLAGGGQALDELLPLGEDLSLIHI